MAVAVLCVTKALSTLMRFQQYAKTHRSIRVHTTVLIRFDCPSTSEISHEMSETDRIARCNVS